MKIQSRWLRAMLLALAVVLSGAGTAHAQGVKALVYTGPADATTDAGVTALKAIGTANQITVDTTAVATDITTTKLADYRAVVFLNTAGAPALNPDQQAALQKFVEAGNGFLGIGSAAQTLPGSTFYDGLIGARPATNSPTATTTQTLVAGDRVHPATKDLAFMEDRSDVWYTWGTRPTGNVHTVARYKAVGAAAGDGTNVGGTDNPISWCRDYRGGRSFYTGMGRIASAWDANFSKHLTGAMLWVTGNTRANCKATINSSYTRTQLVGAGPTDTGLATAGESHGIAIANNGWVLYIGRGDCRTDAERGALVGGSPFGRILDHSNPRVGIGCGSVHIYDPAQATNTLNSGITRAGTLAVYGDGGTGGERTSDADHKMEYGLLGIAPAPDFATSGYVYLQYFPTFDETSTPPGLPVARRISKMSQPRISRFKIDLATKKLDLKSEVVIFQYDAQIYSCCHVGGGMGFDSQGNLYVTTGDTNSSQGTSGYSGNNPVAKCPTGDNTIASSANCGTAGYSYQDARRTAGNTNDYNGKMLRFKPVAGLADGSKLTPGVGTTYTLPNAASPNGPNLFDGTEGGGGKTKPEIYAMGLRNPSRLSIDPKTDVPYTAWVGPDASAPSATAGPSTYENAAQITRAGNYGWPYCMGNKQAYRDRIADGTQRTANAAGYVSGGPATGGTDGWYDCDNIVNDSPNNTGLTTLPHTTGTGADSGKVRGNNVWYSRGNPGNTNGCPDFPRDRGAGNAPNYGATAANVKQLCPYAQDSGMTIMDGPVYRYQSGADNSRRWPAYWDGRWFLHNNGGASIKHGLVLDPATAGTGGQPIWADSLRNTLAWSGSYMDSKFGPDGALYVQTYDGFFRAGANVGIYRYDYTGGAPTPSAAPRGVAIGSNKVRFSIGSSGGATYLWEFGDGTTSNEVNPTHTYPEAKTYTAKLTVTYADGTKDSGTVNVDVLSLADTAAPVTTGTLTPASPGAGGTYTKAVSLTLTATDPAGGSGVELTEYRINGGEWLTYSAPVTRQQPGMYLIEYRSTDRTGNVETAKSVAFTVALPQNCPTNMNDEFDGPTLDPKWEIIRDVPTARSFENGRLKMLVRAGDMIGATATAKNLLVQKAPAGSWSIQTKLDVSTLTAEGEQAGFILWNQENPNTFAKITYISKGTYSQWEWVATRAGANSINTGTQFTTPFNDVYLRVSSNGSGTYIAEGSIDGEKWEQISGNITNLGDPSTIKFGIKISDNTDSTHYAAFDWFRVDCSDRVPPTTTATLTPDTADGKLGWYKTTPTVALKADDGALGQVAKVEYSVDGGALKTYTGPFTVPGLGEHKVEYFATDAAENVEAKKSLAFRVDGSAPVTEATTTGDMEKGPVKVKLDSVDGDTGSGAVLTEYRVDGGPWKTYASKDEQIFDGSAASLQQWRQAPSGRFDLMTDGSKGITPVGGLGMLWFPKAYGDFRVKLQFREGRTDGGNSNGGVFVRFPDPRTHVDTCSQTGTAATDEAWVAINCGHEMQIYDGETGETRKTGSIYTFDNNTLAQIGPKKPLGQWEDYEIQVVGQTYQIFRNGVRIKQFENSPGKVSDRAGDPPTAQRQFAKGYIGLQNHGGADTIQYRNIRVEDLTPGAPGKNATGEFEVSGVGPHTIEVRSIDAAGNAEAPRTFDLEIGRKTPPGSTDGAGPSVLQPGGQGSAFQPVTTSGIASFRLGKVAKSITRTTIGRRGLTVPVICTGAMTGTAKLTISAKMRKRLKLKSSTIRKVTVKCWGPQTAKVALKPSKALKRKLARKGGPKSVKMTLAVQMTAWGRPATTIKKTVTLKRTR